MQRNLVTINGETYNRQVELIGDVEKITYFHVIKTQEDYNFNDLYLEVYDQDFANELEFIFEQMCTAEFTPQLFFI